MHGDFEQKPKVHIMDIKKETKNSETLACSSPTVAKVQSVKSYGACTALRAVFIFL